MREEKKDPGKPGPFYKVEARHAELVELGELSLVDLGALSLMGCKVNPHYGYMITNHSNFARMANLRGPDTARYIFEKLEAAGCIRFFPLQRGRYSKGLLFVIGRDLASGVVVSNEFASNTAQRKGVFSELEKEIPNKKEGQSINTDRNDPRESFRINRDRDDTETETKTDKGVISRDIFDGLIASMGEEKAKAYTLGKGYSLPSQGVAP